MKELTLKQLQAFCLEILKDVDAFCRANDIKYAMAYGTLLGAIRHKGFIPWDDDIDLVMTRENYEKFCALWKSDKYELIHSGNTPDCLIAFARVTDFKRTESRSYSPWITSRQDPGVWIDIFPLDYAPDDEGVNFKLYKACRALYEFSNIVRKTVIKILPHTPLKFMLKKIGHRRREHGHLHVQGPEQALDWLETVVRESTKNPTKHLSQYVCPDPKIVEWFDVKDFGSYVDLPFEDSAFMAPANYEKVLVDWFGDYMELPPVKKRKNKSRRYLRFYWK